MWLRMGNKHYWQVLDVTRLENQVVVCAEQQYVIAGGFCRLLRR